MKSIVLRDDFREFEIRPKGEFNHYLDLIQQDSNEVFKGNAGNYLRSCPACGCDGFTHIFTKLDFIYRECLACQTLFLSPRPTVQMLRSFYAKSKGLRFWNSTVMQETDARKKHVFGPRLSWVMSTCDINELHDITFLDYYSKYVYFLEEIAEKAGFSRCHTFKPTHPIGDTLKKYNYTKIEELETASYSVITAFEIFDRFYNPQSVLAALHDSLVPDGLLFLTTISASGFDIRILKEKSRSIVPPIHLNIFSVEGMIKMLENVGFEIIELSSPGSLDVDLVATAIDNDPALEIPPVIDDILYNRNDAIQKDFQEFLQRSLLSSHMRVVARKTNASPPE